MLVGTQMDLRDCEVTKEKLIKRKLVPVSTEDGERVRKEMNAFKYLECSAKTQVSKAGYLVNGIDNKTVRR